MQRITTPPARSQVAKSSTSTYPTAVTKKTAARKWRDFSTPFSCMEYGKAIGMIPSGYIWFSPMMMVNDGY
jgi:hypothetical protein